MSARGCEKSQGEGTSEVADERLARAARNIFSKCLYVLEEDEARRMVDDFYAPEGLGTALQPIRDLEG